MGNEQSSYAGMLATATRILCAVAWAATVSTPALADDLKWVGSIYDAFEENNDLTFEFSAGVQYDSNVSVIDIDTQTAEDDFAVVFEAGVDYRMDLSEKTSVNAGYSFDQEILFEFTDFNTQIHRGYIGLTQEVGAVEAGADYQFIYARLGGDGLLRMHRISPHLAGYGFDQKIYWRAAYNYTDKNFIGRTDRDATVHAGGADAFLFINGLNTYLIGGYRYEDEDATAPEFDFDAHNIKLKVVQRIPVGARKAKLGAGWRYEERNYQSITPSIGRIRGDERHKFNVSAKIPINDVLFTELEYNYEDFSSNLPTADFDQNTASIRLGGKL